MAFGNILGRAVPVLSNVFLAGSSHILNGENNVAKTEKHLSVFAWPLDWIMNRFKEVLCLNCAAAFFISSSQSEVHPSQEPPEWFTSYLEKVSICTSRGFVCCLHFLGIIGHFL